MGRLRLYGTNSSYTDIVAPDSGNIRELNLPDVDGSFLTSDIDGNVTVSGVLDFISGTAALPGIAVSGDPNTGLFSPGANILAFATGGGERMRIGSTGNVSIRTTSGTEPLEVARLTNDTWVSPTMPALATVVTTPGINGVGSGSGSAVCIMSGDVGQSAVYFGDSDDADVGYILYSHINDAMIFEVNAAEAMRIDASGNIGINVTEPETPLHIARVDNNTFVEPTLPNDSNAIFTPGTNTATSGTSISILGGSTGLARITFGDENAASAGQISYDNSNDSLRFVVNASEAMRITSTGNVSIGTTTGTEPLEVARLTEGTWVSPTMTNLATIVTTPGNNNSGSGSAVCIMSGNAAESNVYFGDSDDGLTGIIKYVHSNDTMQFHVDSIEWMRINTDGGVEYRDSGGTVNVKINEPDDATGIGITNVQNAGAFVYNVGLSINYPISDSGVTGGYGVISNFTVPASQTMSLLHNFEARGTAYGAGATVPNATGFYVNSNLAQGATNTFGFRGVLASGSGVYNLYMDGTADNYIKGNLNLGDPGNYFGHPLEISSTAFAANQSPSGVLVRTDGDLDSGNGVISGLLMESDGSGIFSTGLYGANSTTAGSQSVSKAFMSTSGGTSQYLTMHSGGGVERMRIDSTGNVLIRTTSGTEPLEVARLTADTWVAPTMPGLATIVTTPGNNNAGSGSAVCIMSGNTAKSIVYFGDSDDADIGYIQYDHNSNFMEFFVNTSERMRIENDGITIWGNTTSSTSVANSLVTSGRIQSNGTYNITTGSAANVFVATTGLLARSTSSIKYKTDVEDAEIEFSESLVFNSRPVWYRSLSEEDPSEYSYWGFIAEEVAEIDPRMVHWSADGQPEGVQYERYVVHLVAVIQKQQQQIEALEQRLNNAGI